jgi:hypothetical protein
MIMVIGLKKAIEDYLFVVKYWPLYVILPWQSYNMVEATVSIGPDVFPPVFFRVPNPERPII